MDEYLANKRQKILERKTRVLLDLRDSVAYRDAIKILGERNLKLTDSAGFYETTISGFQNRELKDVGISARRIRNNIELNKKSDTSLWPEQNPDLGKLQSPAAEEQTLIYFEDFEEGFVL